MAKNTGLLPDPIYSTSPEKKFSVNRSIYLPVLVGKPCSEVWILLASIWETCQRELSFNALIGSADHSGRAV
jgi:hypothetical protein